MHEIAEQYLRWKKTYTRSAGSSYAPWVRLFDEIGTPDLKTYLSFSERVRARYGERSAAYGIAVIHDYVGFLERHHVTDLSQRDIKIPKPRRSPRPHLTTEEYIAMLTWIRADTVSGLRDNALIRMLYDTGARIGEIASLTRYDIDLKSRTAEVSTEKTDRRRVIVWGSDTNRFLAEFMEQQPSGLFPSKRSCERIVRKYAELAKIRKHITCHSFRHTRAHVILDNGGTVKDVQETLGHLHPESSFAYLSLSRTEAISRSRKFLDLG